jgi:hypothetical protein
MIIVPEAMGLQALSDPLPAPEPLVVPPEATEHVSFVDDFRTDLAHLLRKEPTTIGRVRKVEGSPPKYSLVDIVIAITGFQSEHANRSITYVTRADKDVIHLMDVISLPDSTGVRKQLTPVADIQTVLRIIIQLPCRNLGPLKREICEVFSRFMGGDLSLIPELQANHARQQTLLNTGSQAPEAAFGEYVRATRPPPPLDIWRTPVPQGVGDYDNKHYILGSLTHPDMYKTGHTAKLMDERLKEIIRDQPQELGLYVSVVYHYEGCLENRVRLKLDSWGCRPPPTEYGIKGTEFRIASKEMIIAAMDEVKRECDANQHGTPGEYEEEKAFKRRRLCLEVSREEFEFEERKFTLKRARDNPELAIHQYKLQVQKEELELEKQKFELEKQRFEFEKIKREYVRVNLL